MPAPQAARRRVRDRGSIPARRQLHGVRSAQRACATRLQRRGRGRAHWLAIAASGVNAFGRLRRSRILWPSPAASACLGAQGQRSTSCKPALAKAGGSPGDLDGRDPESRSRARFSRDLRRSDWKRWGPPSGLARHREGADAGVLRLSAPSNGNLRGHQCPIEHIRHRAARDFTSHRPSRTESKGCGCSRDVRQRRPRER